MSGQHAPAFIYTVRVSYADTDAMRFVHHSRYLVYFESARTELLRATGSTYAEWERRGYLLPVTRADVEFLQPARYDEVLEVTVRIARLERLRLAFEYEVRRAGEDRLLSRARTEHVFINEKGAPQRAPKEFLQPLEEWLRGERPL